MNSFIQGVLSSIVAALLIVFVTGVLAKRARRFFFIIIANLIKIDTEAVYKNKKDAEADVEYDLKRAKYILLITGRGNELQRDFFADYLSGRYQKQNKKIKILLPKIELNEDEPDWLKIREIELSAFDSAYGQDILKKQINTTLEYLEAPLRENKIEVKVFNFPQISRVIITDAVIYLNPYPKDYQGRDSELIKFRRGGVMYSHYKRTFELLWDNASLI